LVRLLHSAAAQGFTDLMIIGYYKYSYHHSRVPGEIDVARAKSSSKSMSVYGSGFLPKTLVT